MNKENELIDKLLEKMNKERVVEIKVKKQNECTSKNDVVECDYKNKNNVSKTSFIDNDNNIKCKCGDDCCKCEDKSCNVDDVNFTVEGCGDDCCKYDDETCKGLYLGDDRVTDKDIYCEDIFSNKNKYKNVINHHTTFKKEDFFISLDETNKELPLIDEISQAEIYFDEAYGNNILSLVITPIRKYTYLSYFLTNSFIGEVKLSNLNFGYKDEVLTKNGEILEVNTGIIFSMLDRQNNEGTFSYEVKIGL